MGETHPLLRRNHKPTPFSPFLEPVPDQSSPETVNFPCFIRSSTKRHSLPHPPTPSLLHQRHKRDTWNQWVCRCLCLGSCAWGSFERSLAFTQDPGPAVHFLWRLSKFPYSFSHSLSTAHLQTPASTTGSSGGFQSPIRLMSLCITQDTSPEQLFPMEIGINKGTALSEKHPGPNPVLGNGFKITRAHSTRLAKPVLPVSN